MSGYITPYASSVYNYFRGTPIPSPNPEPEAEEAELDPIFHEEVPKRTIEGFQAFMQTFEFDVALVQTASPYPLESLEFYSYFQSKCSNPFTLSRLCRQQMIELREYMFFFRELPFDFTLFDTNMLFIMLASSYWNGYPNRTYLVDAVLKGILRSPEIELNESKYNLLELYYDLSALTSEEKHILLKRIHMSRLLKDSVLNKIQDSFSEDAQAVLKRVGKIVEEYPEGTLKQHFGIHGPYGKGNPELYRNLARVCASTPELIPRVRAELKVGGQDPISIFFETRRHALYHLSTSIRQNA